MLASVRAHKCLKTKDKSRAGALPCGVRSSAIRCLHKRILNPQTVNPFPFGGVRPRRSSRGGVWGSPRAGQRNWGSGAREGAGPQEDAKPLEETRLQGYAPPPRQLLQGFPPPRGLRPCSRETRRTKDGPFPSVKARAGVAQPQRARAVFHSQDVGFIFLSGLCQTKPNRGSGAPGGWGVRGGGPGARRPPAA